MSDKIKMEVELETVSYKNENRRDYTVLGTPSTVQRRED